MSRSSSSKRRHKEKIRKPQPLCGETGKHRHGSRKRALSALNELRAAAKTARRPVAVYRCGFCSGWHLTSQEQRTRPR
jgi:ribosomal protein L34E